MFSSPVLPRFQRDEKAVIDSPFDATPIRRRRPIKSERGLCRRPGQRDFLVLIDFLLVYRPLVCSAPAIARATNVRLPVLIAPLVVRN